ncbi:MAG TPA: hypothetical protein VF469_06855 [Kofleriaceae bacterium]
MHADLRPRVRQYLFVLGLAVALAACAIDSDPSSGVDERPATSALQADVSLAPPPPDPKSFIFLCPSTLVCTFDDIACNNSCDVPCVVRRFNCP